MAPHVINNSWYCSDTEGCNPSNWDFMETAVNNLKASGIVVVVSAGNSGPNCNTISEVPAIFENSFSIGATRSNDTIANFSSRGLVSVDSTYRIKPNVSAPGQNVRSVIRGGNFANFSGTSMAGPHVAGMVALLISARPQLAGEVELIETIIENSAVPKISNQECDGLLPSNIPNPTYGHGRIDVLAAYKNLISSVDDNLSINNKYKIYPNPSTGVVNIISNTAENFEIQVLDKNGKTVINPSFNKDFNNIRLDISKLSSGIYYILLKSNTSLVVEKLVKI
jgi:subtilisin family serine protease